MVRMCSGGRLQTSLLIRGSGGWWQSPLGLGSVSHGRCEEQERVIRRIKRSEEKTRREDKAGRRAVGRVHKDTC